MSIPPGRHRPLTSHTYFEVPRSVNIDDLVEVVGISDNAHSQRLRRGLSRLIYETMVNHRDEPFDCEGEHHISRPSVAPLSEISSRWRRQDPNGTNFGFEGKSRTP
ncbi:helix-turn-helix domain-containing protein [Haloarchaeobius sp. DT45]|uniref:helix-turn-helix domain-containing protein n=1 Tax=Haloarchaeobius sp. DT45 TaxID=3446116 RepID=UPI003F6D8F92